MLAASLDANQVPDDEVDAISHANAMRHFRYDPFARLSRDQCTVGALRARATDVDITIRSSPRAAARVAAAGPKLTKSTDLIKTAEQRR
jgi:hypothetical protein